MGKQGFRDTNDNPYVYQEVEGGASVAIGIDNSDSDKTKFVALATTGATPDGTSQLNLNPATDKVELPQEGSGVVQTDSNGVITSDEGTDGQLLISSSSGAPDWANILSSDASVVITNTANGIDLSSTSPGQNVIITTFTSNGTWTKNAGTQWITVYGWNGGSGGGGGMGTSGNPFGGSGGAYNGSFYQTFPAVHFGATETVTIGAGGAGGTPGGGTPGTNGALGGQTSIGDVTAPTEPTSIGLRGENSVSGPVPGGVAGKLWSNSWGITPPSGEDGGAGNQAGPGGTPTRIGGLTNKFMMSGSGGAGGAHSGGAGSEDAGVGGEVLNIDDTTTILAGGVAGTVPGGDGGDGLASSTITSGGYLTGGSGGGGGAGDVASGPDGGDGGDGGIPGGGGGGGGTSRGGGGGVGGTGGAGARGEVVVIEFL